MNHNDKAAHIEGITQALQKLRELADQVDSPDLQGEMKLWLNHIDSSSLALFVMVCGV